jgi:hypothetical protein
MHHLTNLELAIRHRHAVPSPIAAVGPASRQAHPRGSCRRPRSQRFGDLVAAVAEDTASRSVSSIAVTSCAHTGRNRKWQQQR